MIIQGSKIMVIFLMLISIEFSSCTNSSKAGGFSDPKIGEEITLAGGWINEGYYASIISGKSPMESFPSCRPVSALIITGDTDSVTIIWNFHESEMLPLKIVGGSLQTIHPDRNYPVYSITTRTDNILLESSRGLSASFVRYPYDYRTNNIPEEMLNREFIAGEYRDPDADAGTVTFGADGTVAGLDGFNGYRIGYDFIEVVSRDFLFLFNSGNQRDVFFWESNGDTLRLIVPHSDEWFLDGSGLDSRILIRTESR